MPAHALCLMQSVFVKTSNHPGDSASLQPKFGTLQLLTFPKTKIIFEREEISDHRWDSGKYNGAADGDWENCVWSQGAYFEGDWGTVLGAMLLVSCIFSNKCLYISCYMAGYILDRPYTYIFFPNHSPLYQRPLWQNIVTKQSSSNVCCCAHNRNWFFFN